jgi:hypothetical protein
MRRTAELRVDLQIRIEERNLRFAELERVQRVEKERFVFVCVYICTMGERESIFMCIYICIYV